MMFKAYCHDISGATAIEYGLIAALIGVAIIGAASLLGEGMEQIYDKTASSIT